MTFPEGEGSQGITLEKWIKQHPLKPDQEMALHDISRGESSSSHLAVIRKAERLHIHQDHDAVAILLKGEGILTLGRRQLHLKPGAVISIPRGVPHAFENQSKEPAVAYAVFMPPFDRQDIIEVQQ